MMPAKTTRLMTTNGDIGNPALFFMMVTGVLALSGRLLTEFTRNCTVVLVGALSRSRNIENKLRLNGTNRPNGRFYLQGAAPSSGLCARFDS